jgi:hypothetical protein
VSGPRGEFEEHLVLLADGDPGFLADVSEVLGWLYGCGMFRGHGKNAETAPDDGEQRDVHPAATQAGPARQAMFETVAQLGHEELIAAVAGLAGEDLVDQLVVHMRVLRHRYKERTTGYPVREAVTTRLAEMPVRGVAAECGDDQASWAMHMVTGGDKPPVFAATTAGFVRRAFGTEWLDTMALATLPAPLPQDGAAPVVLYGTLGVTASGLLDAVRDGTDPAEEIAALTDRIVGHRPFPWEQGGCNGD